MATSNVTLLLDGLIVLAAKIGDPTGEAGVLKFHPFHTLSIFVTRDFPNGTSRRDPVNGIQDEMNLAIDPPTTITARDPTAVINRMAHPVDHLDSYNWFVDLEDNHLFYPPPLEAKRDGFKPIIKFNGGELFTALPPNDSILDVYRGLTLDAEHIGRVALKLGVDFRGATRAVFTNGGQTVFDSNTEPGTNYLIEVSNNRAGHLPISTDANFYYSAVGRNIGAERLITFSSSGNSLHLLNDSLEDIQAESERNPEFERKLQEIIDKLNASGRMTAGPEAACFPAYLSQSKLIA